MVRLPGMRIPVWLTIGVAILVISFGIYRIRLSFRSGEADERATQKRGLYAMSRGKHRFVGSLYLLLGIALVATSFGFNPLGSLFGPGTEEPAKGAEPTKAPLPEDGLKK
jgi:hypothetical protein